MKPKGALEMKGRANIRTRVLRWVAAGGLLVALAGVAELSRPGAPLQPAEAFNAPELAFRPDDRILILAPHPDDETIACGGVIQRAVNLGLPVRVVFLTNGDANEWSFVLYRRQPELLRGQVEAMGLVRHDEALAATQVLGLKPEQLTFLGYPDFGTLRIWLTHWGAEPPLRSMLTRVTEVPYANAYRPGAAYRGEEILADLKAVLKDFRPTKVFLSHPADHNPDHLALYTFTRVALWDLGMAPESVPLPGAHPKLARAARPGIGPDADAAGPARRQGPWWTLPLTPEEIGRKLTALEAHRTQYEASPGYLSSFVRANELFNAYPEAALRAGGAEMGLAADAEALDAQAPQELTDAERAAFVGVDVAHRPPGRQRPGALAGAIETARQGRRALRLSFRLPVGYTVRRHAQDSRQRGGVVPGGLRSIQKAGGHGPACAARCPHHRAARAAGCFGRPRPGAGLRSHLPGGSAARLGRLAGA